MAWTGLHVGDYGTQARLTLKQDGTAADISTYTTREYYFIDPSGNESTAKTASFDDDGTDGVLTYTIEDGLLDASGPWRVYAVISKTGVENASDAHEFYVAARGE